jgi:DNA-binding transcriptional ArsR family regulator
MQPHIFWGLLFPAHSPGGLSHRVGTAPEETPFLHKGDNMSVVAVEKVLSYPGLTDREIRLLLTIDTLQAVRGVIKAELEELLEVSRSTIERTLRSLKDKGLLLMQRLGSSKWFYRFSVALQPGDDPHVSSSSSSFSPLEKERSNYYLTHVALQPGDDPRLEMAPLKFKYRTPFVDALVGAVDRPPKKPKKPISFTEQSREDRLRSKMAEKDVSEYTCTDMRFIFEDEWKRAEWKGRAPRWTGKDYGLMKMMMEEFGPEDTVKYVQYICRNWGDLCKRYRVNGYPSVGAMKSFGSSWYPEMMNGLSFVPTVEYRDRSMVESSSHDSDEFDQEAVDAIDRAMEIEARKREARKQRAKEIEDLQIKSMKRLEMLKQREAMRRLEARKQRSMAEPSLHDEEAMLHDEEAMLHDEEAMKRTAMQIKALQIEAMKRKNT